MERLIEMLLVEHEKIREYMRETEHTINNVIRFREIASPEESMEALRISAELGLKITLIAGAFSEHESLEESTVYPQIEQVGYSSELATLREQHRTLRSIVDEAVYTVRAYKKGEVDLGSLSQKILNLYMRLAEIVEEHFKLEEEVFSKVFELKGHKGQD